MKEKIRTIGSWYELVDLVESINPNKKSIILVGWLNEIYKERTYISKLIFSTMDVNVLKNGDKKNVKKIQKLAKQSNITNSKKQ